MASELLRLEHHPLASSSADQRETGIVSNLDIHGIRNQTKETKSQRFDIESSMLGRNERKMKIVGGKLKKNCIYFILVKTLCSP